ncbi:hypothetical protein [Alteromonas stellipolaris]|uniref:hypothetical protein n=1 Tax=Alteromonas stellipolaris TaxID=233316 RepID=UPI001DFDF5E6|nr:hypothetical protein [Alteromonas stellipolaris]MBZ2163330.1 hypothetical protein [Alteromonas stellipolaris]
MRLAINKIILIKDPLPGENVPAIHYTIVTVSANQIVLCLQDMKRPKRPFVHNIGEPIPFAVYNDGEAMKHFKNWKSIEVIDNNFHNAKSVIWFNKLKLAQNNQKFDFNEQYKRYIKNKESTQNKLEVVEAFEYQSNWDLNCFGELKNGLTPVRTLKQKKDNRYLYFTKIIGKKEMKAFLKHYKGLSYASFLRMLYRYYAFGQSFEALLPEYHGASERNKALRPQNAEMALIKFPNGRGAKSTFNKVVNDVDTEFMKEFIKSLQGRQYFSMASLLDEYNGKYGIYFDDEQREFIPIRENMLTYRQFQRLFIEVLGGEDKYQQLKKGRKGFTNDDAVGTGSALSQAVTAAYQYEVDATYVDLYLTSKYSVDEVKVMKRVWLIGVVDKATSMTAGYYLTLRSPTEEDICLALYNAFTDKVDFCRKYGVEIEYDDWPCHHIPTSILFDNGNENKESLLDRIVQEKLPILTIELAESYQGKQKGTAERKFGSFNTKAFHRLAGAVLKKVPKAAQHASKKAIFTLDDLNHILIHTILDLNNISEVEDRLKGQHLDSGVRPHPRDIWVHDINRELNGGEVATPSKVLETLLPRQTALIYQHSIKLQGVDISYVSHSAAFRRFHQRAFSTHGDGVYELEVMVLPNNLSFIWLKDDQISPDIIEFELAERSKKYEQKSIEEHLNIMDELREVRRASAEKKLKSGAVQAARINRIKQKNKLINKDLKPLRGKAPVTDTEANTKIDRAALDRDNMKMVRQGLGTYSNDKTKV